ncbi:5-(carboxyamino)imidazole ribonucleotide synthase [Pseudolactococcus insecticola]|uniref:N5-carboxyaminoimidazole ribonucleotide synthase n=1 Tax=Pseudolactococcus insecticola TaxID=2709158 RepID=A0A6A0B5B4_9LACT|nr:5-(carboxyamino)imidazole ribonucleotide synthase [Lactococcus insecticola]GFH39895.1 N5-carboxyaminoimidazole ribonucleotide synthase [Lactococcus insecticola]
MTDTTNTTKTIGIIGGGQLGQMMAISAIYMGHNVIALDPDATCPASHVAEMIVAPYDDAAAIAELAARSDVLTYEFENVSADTLRPYADKIPQGLELLSISQNRIFEKAFLTKEAGVKVAPYQVIKSPSDLDQKLDLTKKHVLKTATGGYDGHGQVVIKSNDDIAAAHALAAEQDCVLEEFVDFLKEVSIVISGNGIDFSVFPVFENIHQNNILSKTIMPARISKYLAEEAEKMAVSIAKSLKLSGTLCVEMFVTANDILVNEIAPRPHNSGHVTIEACDFSQFDLHIRGVLAEKLPKVKVLSPAVMLQVLGQDLSAARHFTQENPSAHLHLYGKIEAKHNRKMGHVTILSDKYEDYKEF